MPPKQKDDGHPPKPPKSGIKAGEPLVDEIARTRLIKLIAEGRGEARAEAIQAARESGDIRMLDAILEAMLGENDELEFMDALAEIAGANKGHPALDDAARKIASHFDGGFGLPAFYAMSILADSDPGRYSHYTGIVLEALENNLRTMTNLPETSEFDSFEVKVDKLFEGMTGSDALYGIVVCLGSLRSPEALPHLRRLAFAEAGEEPDELTEAIEDAIRKIESHNKH